MLMSGRGREARIHYLDGTFRLLRDGDHVRLRRSPARASRSTNCAIGGSSGRKPMPTPPPAWRPKRRRKAAAKAAIRLAYATVAAAVTVA